MSDAVIDMLRRASGAFQARLQEMPAIAELGLSPYQARLLSVIGRYPALSQLSLAAATERDKAQVARTIKELEKRGLVERTQHETDWRTQCLSLTGAGTRAASLIDTQRAELAATALRECSPDEQDALYHLLAKIERAIGP